MTRVLLVVVPVLGVAGIIAVARWLGDRSRQDSGDPYDWQ